MLRPENPADPESSTLEIRVAVVPALNLVPEGDPVVPIAGGPGQGTIEFYAMVAGAFEGVRRNRDILLVDQRGTGDSSTMDCPIPDDAIMFETEYSLDDTMQYVEECLAGLPHDPRFFTTSVAVTDLEAIRQALGYTALNLYGVSYGSRVAQHFARQYPDSTRTVTIDGVVPPQIALGPEIATESQKAVDIVPNPNTGRLEELAFGEGQFAGAVRLLVYSPNTIALLPLLIDEAGLGNFAPIAAQFMLTVISMTDALALGMHNSIMCTEDVPFLDDATIDHEAIAASYMGSFQVEMLKAMCATWPAGPIDMDFKAPVKTDIPFLMLSGDADPITPPRYAEMAAVELGNAVHLVGENQGHGQISVGCMGRVFANFVESADPSTLETDCMERNFVTPFFLDFSGPAP
jgi:pimeloyl-ACP methyl ester carboxylesterase